MFFFRGIFLPSSSPSVGVKSKTIFEPADPIDFGRACLILVLVKLLHKCQRNAFVAVDIKVDGVECVAPRHGGSCRDDGHR